jgi:riboflavin synthase
MFTGIVTDIGEVLAAQPRAQGLTRLTIACRYERASIIEGASIACAGVCLTVVGVGESAGVTASQRTWFAVDAAAETLQVTSAGRWRAGTRINLERALKVGDELGGHIVGGHVDGLALLTEREELTEMARLTLRAPARLGRFIAPKGSVTLDGVSLTVNAVVDDSFSVLVIPHTLRATTLGTLSAGEEVNLEVDLMARYAARLMAQAAV